MPRNSEILGERLTLGIQEYRSGWTTDWFTPIRLHILKKSQHELLDYEDREYSIKGLPASVLNEENYTVFINPYAIGILHLAELIRTSTAEERKDDMCGHLLLNINGEKIFNKLNGWKVPDYYGLLFGMTYMSENGLSETVHDQLGDYGAIRVGTEFLVTLPDKVDEIYDRLLKNRKTSGAPFHVARRHVYFACNGAKDCYAAQFLAIRNNLFTYSQFAPLSDDPKEKSKSFTITARHFSDVNTIGFCFDEKRNYSKRPYTKAVNVLIFLGGESEELDTKLIKLAEFLKKEDYKIEVLIGYRTLKKIDKALEYMTEFHYEDLTRSNRRTAGFRCLSKRPTLKQDKKFLDQKFHFAVAPCHWLKPDINMFASSFTMPVRLSSRKEHIEIFSYNYGPTLLGFTQRVFKFLEESGRARSLSPMPSNQFLGESLKATSSSMSRSRSLTKNRLSPAPAQGKPPRDRSRSTQRLEPDYDTYIKTLLEPEERVVELKPRKNGRSKSQSSPHSKERSSSTKKKSIKEKFSSSHNLAGTQAVEFSKYRESYTSYNYKLSMPALDKVEGKVDRLMFKSKIDPKMKYAYVDLLTVEPDPNLAGQGTSGSLGSSQKSSEDQSLKKEEKEKSKKSHGGSKKHKKSKKNKK